MPDVNKGFYIAPVKRANLGPKYRPGRKTGVTRAATIVRALKKLRKNAVWM